MSIEQWQSSPPAPRPGAELAVAPSATVSRLTDWAQSAGAAYEVATRLVATSFVPEAFRRKPDEATAAILAGDEVGLSPMASLRAFDIIQGVAAPRAITHRAVVQSLGHEIWVEESTSARAIVCGRRRGETQVQRSEWTIERARGLGLTTKHNWKNQPGAMLVARATSECARMIASDALMGMPYSVEELHDTEAAETATDGPPVARRAARRRTAAPAAALTAGAAPDVPRAAPVAAGPPPLPGEDGYDVDWNAALADAVEQGLPALQVLWHTAKRERPDDKDLRMRIEAAATAAKALESPDPADPEPVDDDPQPVEPPFRPMTRSASAKLFALLNGAGIKGDEARHDWATAVLERDIGSFKSLSVADGDRLIRRLEDEQTTDGDGGLNYPAEDPQDDDTDIEEQQ